MHAPSLPPPRQQQQQQQQEEGGGVEEVEDDQREPFYIYLQNTELNARVQKYISAFVQHIASILEKDEPHVRRIVSFLPERNGRALQIPQRAITKNTPQIGSVACGQSQSYAIVSVERIEEREADQRLMMIKRLLENVLLVSDNEDSITRDAQKLCSLVTTEEEFAEVLQFATQIGGNLTCAGFKNVGHNRKKPAVRVAVTGAAGAIGYSLLPRIASGEMLGPEQPVILHLIERPEVLKSLDGVAMELQDGANPLLRGVKVTADYDEGFDKADFALLVGAKPRGPGMERGDLLKDNGAIFRDVGKAIDRKANKNILTLVVGNPANTNALVTSANAPNVDPKQFSAMTRLDHNRAIAQLALKLNTTPASIKKMAIWGNHSATQVPDHTHAVFDGKSVKDQIKDDKWFYDTFFPAVQKRGAAIISARGSSSAASAADSAIKHMRDWSQGSNGEWVSMGIVSDGSYGVREGIYSSYPVICQGEGKYEIVQGLKLDKEIQTRLDKSVKELLDEKSAVKNLLKK